MSKQRLFSMCIHPSNNLIIINILTRQYSVELVDSISSICTGEEGHLPGLY